MRSSRISPGPDGSGSDLLSFSSCHTPTTWSMRTWPKTADMVVTGESFKQANYTHNKPERSSSITRNSQVRSYLQAKVGKRRKKSKSGKDGTGDASKGNDTGDRTSQDNLQNNRVSKSQDEIEGDIEQEPKSLLDSVVDKADLDLFTSSRQHLDAINLNTQFQQAICDEMRWQAQTDKNSCDKIKEQVHRFQNVVDIPNINGDQVWLTQAFQDMRESLTGRVHELRVYSLTLLSQSSTIQQSLDSHRDVMELSKEPPPAITSTKEGSGLKVGGMTFLQAIQSFEAVRRPRLKLLNEADYLNEQVKSIEQQLKDVEVLVSGLKEAQTAEQAAWRVQHKIEEARTRQDFLSTRHDQLKMELAIACTNLTNFHLSNRDKMKEVVDVFRQHRDRCDSTLRKSFTLLQAAITSDQEVLKTLDSSKWSWLGTETAAETPTNEGSGSSNSLLKRASSRRDKNPLKTKTVCFEDSCVDVTLTEGRDDDTSSNHSFSMRRRGRGDTGTEAVTMEPSEVVSSTSASPSKRSIKSVDHVSMRGSHTEVDKKRNTLTGRPPTPNTQHDATAATSKKRSKEYQNVLSGFTGNDGYSMSREARSHTKHAYHEYERSNVPASPGRLSSRGDDRYSNLAPDQISNYRLPQDSHERQLTSHGRSSSSNSPAKAHPHNPFERLTMQDAGSLTGETVRQDSARIPSVNSEYLQRQGHNVSSNGNKPIPSKNNETRKGRSNKPTGKGPSTRKPNNPSPTNTASDITLSLENSSSKLSDSQDQSPDTTIFLSTQPQKQKLKDSKTKSRNDERIDDKNQVPESPLKDCTSNSSDGASSSLESDSACDESIHTQNIVQDKGRTETLVKQTEGDDTYIMRMSDFDTQGRTKQTHRGHNDYDIPSRSSDAEGLRRVDTPDTKRRVAFSDLDPNSKSVKESNFEAAYSCAPGKKVIADRGILKKPSDRNITPKTIFIKERLDEGDVHIITSDQGHISPDTRQLGTAIQPQTAESNSDQEYDSDKPSPNKVGQKTVETTPPVRPLAVKKSVFPTVEAFIPESSDDVGSDTSYSPEEISPRKRIKPRQNIEQNETLAELLREKSRQEMEEDDRINSFIKKYASNHRNNYFTLSKNFNNSDTSVMTQNLKTGFNEHDTQAETIGLTDKLDFDVDSGRKIKVCAVRPISSINHESRVIEASVSEQHTTDARSLTVRRNNLSEEDAHVAGNVTQPESALSQERLNYLKQYEVTAGQFVESSKPEETMPRVTQVDVGCDPILNESLDNNEPCLWSVQMYSDMSSEDTNNNLSSPQHTHLTVLIQSSDKTLRSCLKKNLTENSDHKWTPPDEHNNALGESHGGPTRQHKHVKFSEEIHYENMSSINMKDNSLIGINSNQIPQESNPSEQERISTDCCCSSQTNESGRTADQQDNTNNSNVDVVNDRGHLLSVLSHKRADDNGIARPDNCHRQRRGLSSRSVFVSLSNLSKTVLSYLIPFSPNSTKIASVGGIFREK